MTNRIVGRAELNAVRHDPSKDISVYTRAMADAVKKLTAMGVTIDETYHKDLLLINLHPSYSSVRTVLLTRAAEPTLKDVTDLLTASAADPYPLAFIARAAPVPRRSALAATSSSPLTGSISSDGFPQDSRWCDPTNSNCHRCGRVGHIAHKCMHTMPAFVKDWINSNLRNPQSHKAAFASALDAGIDPEVFLELWGIHVGERSLICPLIGLSWIWWEMECWIWWELDYWIRWEYLFFGCVRFRLSQVGVLNVVLGVVWYRRVAFLFRTLSRI
ncbi:hypothetical protein R3P38DRAFT_2623913 [Favolaschia claudopus]|uniref:CCHC-type domain-containing protein n=2 Tax=Favolaschia claudopus TaxID=2862362 RepID=A0AAW0BMW6_9AGAR